MDIIFVIIIGIVFAALIFIVKHIGISLANANSDIKCPKCGTPMNYLADDADINFGDTLLIKTIPYHIHYKCPKCGEIKTIYVGSKG